MKNSKPPKLMIQETVSSSVQILGLFAPSILWPVTYELLKEISGNISLMRYWSLLRPRRLNIVSRWGSIRLIRRKLLI